MTRSQVLPATRAHDIEDILLRRHPRPAPHVLESPEHKERPLSIDQYMLMMKSYVDGLRATRNPISEETLILYVLVGADITKSGLNSRVPPTRRTQVTFNNDTELQNLREVVAQVQSHTNTLRHDQADTRVFPTTLVEATQQWYFKLTPGKFDSWDSFISEFNTQFPSFRPLPLHLEDLFKVKQLPNEPLKDHISQFMTEATRVRGLTKEGRLAAVLGGIMPLGDLWKDIKRLMVNSMVEFLDKADGFIKLEEGVRNAAPRVVSTGQKQNTSMSLSALAPVDLRFSQPIEESYFLLMLATCYKIRTKKQMLDETQQQQKTKKGKKKESMDNSSPRASSLLEKEPNQFMAQQTANNPIFSMIHQTDEAFDNQSSSSKQEETFKTWSQDSDTSNESQDLDTSDESQDSNTSKDEVPSHFMAQSAEEAYSQIEPIVKSEDESEEEEVAPMKIESNHHQKSTDRDNPLEFCVKIHQKLGHYAKQCPKGKIVKLLSHIQQTTGMSLKENYIESIFSTDDEFNSESLYPFKQWSDSDTPECYQMSIIQTMQPSPIITVQVLPTKYAKPIKVVGFFDTGASYKIMNPDILPKEYWKKEKQ
uniref:Retrotransposon gag domain-containing protein n=1 Tax=Cannabis sativa TaxID=3483 RepID=A0A803NKP2_CANSA